MAAKRATSCSSGREPSGQQQDRDGQSVDDDPPMSRLFIICNKSNNEEEFRDSFEKFGTIEEIWIVKDKSSGEHKGMHTRCHICASFPFR